MKKTKLSKILGIGLTVALVCGLAMAFAAPVSADDDEWSAYALPDAGLDGDYFMDDTITTVGPMERDVDGYFWAYAEFGAGEDEIMHSLDTEGRTWEITDFSADVAGVDIVAIVCSPLDANVVYAADVNEVYKTEDGGDTWEEVGDFDIDIGGDISTLAVGWDDDNDPRVFVGCTDDAAGDDDGDATDDGIFYLYDVPFGADWASLELDVGEDAGLDDDLSVFGLAVSPTFADDPWQAALVVSTENGQTFLVSHEGSDTGGWTAVEIDDDADADMEATEGSDPVFPSDWTGPDWEGEDTEVFVGIVGPLHAGGEGGVVRIYGDDAGDFEILDDIDDDVRSMDIVGAMGSTQMLAGEEDDADVWFSWDDGDNWEQATVEGIGPAGAGPVLAVAMDSAFNEDAGMGWATTDGAECGVSMTIDGGTSWQGVGLMDTDIDELLAAAIVVDSPEMVYLLTEDAGNAAELLRYDSGADVWTRLYEEAQYNIGAPDTFAVLGDTILLADAGNTDIIVSSNAGQTFAAPDEEPADNINALLLVDEETWWVGDDDGDLYVTDDAGDRTWDVFDITNDAITSLAVRGDEAICGTADGEIWYSEDAGETWDIVGEQIDATAADNDTYVCFDAGNDNSDVIYAASDDTLARFQFLTTDLTEDWEVYDDGTAPANTLDDATGIACLEGVLYAGNGDDAEGVMRVVEPLFDLDDVTNSEIDEEVDAGMAAGDILDGGIIITATSPNTIWGIETGAGGDQVLWTYTDLMIGPTAGLMASPDTTTYTLAWDGFGNATDYEVASYSDEDMRAAYVSYDQDTGDDDPLVIVDDDNAGEFVDGGTNYWWQVRASAPVHSKWSAVSSFNTGAAQLGVDEDTFAPSLGATNVPASPSFAWGNLEDADSYVMQLSDTADFSNILEEATVTSPSYQATSTLNAGQNYFWRVKSIAGATESIWSVGTFTIAVPAPEAPTPPPPAEAPQIVIPAAEQIAPKWIYAIIGIGATLATVVIVLITKTRKH